MHCALDLPDGNINGDDRIKDPSIIDGNSNKAVLELNKIQDVPLINGNVNAERSKVHIGHKIYTDKAVVLQYPYSAHKQDELDPYGLCNIIQTPPKKTDNNNEVFIQDNEKFKIRRRYLLYGAVIFILIAVLCTMATVFLLPTSKDGIYEEALLCVISREQWQPLNQTGELTPFASSPVHYVILSHTVFKNCNATEDCKVLVREVQLFHFSLHFSDIGYNFLVGGDGCVYEGRGWDTVGAHTKNFNSRSIGISLLGNFDNEKPSRKQINAVKLLLEEGLRRNKISANYKLFAHAQVSATNSPGINVIDLMKSWPHWSEYNPNVDGLQ